MSAVSGLEERTTTAVRFSFWRRIFSFPVMLAAVLMVLAVLTVRNRFSDPDMWWHLRTGQVIWNTHTIPRTDLFSWTTHHHAWIPHEWLSQVVIYGAYRLGGYRGLMLFLCIAVSLLLIGGYLLCVLYSRNAKVALVGALVVWFFATSGMAIRPQLIGYLLLIVELIVIHLGSTCSPRWFYWLPPLFAVWVNCHGSFFLGYAIAGVLLVCSFFSFETAAIRSLPWAAHVRRSYILALTLSAAAMFLNPVGLKLILYPLDMMFRQPLNVGQVQEWQPLLATTPRGAGLLVILLAVAVILIYLRRQLELHEIVLLTIATWFALSHQRMAFVFGILAAPVVSRLLSPYWDRYEAAHDLPAANAFMVIAATAIAIAAFPRQSFLLEQVQKNNPAGAADYVRTHALTGHMLNEWTAGGYLVWALPDHPDFIDGRGDIFEETGVLADYSRWALLQSDPRGLLEKYHIDFCLLTSGSPMSHVLPLLPGWKAVYSDDRSVVFVHGATH